jgi:hypothetical protein
MVCSRPLGEELGNDLLGKEFRPFLLFPSAANLVLNNSVPKHRGGDMDTILPPEFDLQGKNALVSMCHAIFYKEHNIPLYFKSSLTAFPPFGLPFNASKSENWSTAFAGMTLAARSASFWRIWRMVRSCDGISK